MLLASYLIEPQTLSGMHVLWKARVRVRLEWAAVVTRNQELEMTQSTIHTVSHQLCLVLPLGWFIVRCTDPHKLWGVLLV
jgi:hypothetical protein